MNSNSKAHKVVPYTFYPCLIIDWWSCMLFIAYYIFHSVTYLWRRKNITSNNFVGLLLNSFSDIVFELQKYNISIGAKYFCFTDKYVLHTFFIYRLEHLQIISWYNYHNRFIGLDVFTCLSMFLIQKYLPRILCNLALDFSNILPSTLAPFVLVIHLTIIKIYFFPLLNMSLLS